MRVPGLSGLMTALCLGGILLVAFATHPQTPLPSYWNPGRPLGIRDAITPVTGWKLRRALSSAALCRAALRRDAVTVARTPTNAEKPDCSIANPVEVARLGQASLAPVITDCRVALRLAMWEHHTLQPAAGRHFGQGVTDIAHLSSYACRPLRTMAGPSARLSSHATGMAIDITGVVLSDGRSIDLSRDWGAAATESAKAAFLRDIRDGACRWFPTALGPDFNALHADHFHLQATGRGLCR